MSELEMVVPERNVAPRSRPVRCCMVRSAKSMLSARCDPSGFPRPATRSCRVVKVRFLNLWHKSKIPDLSHYQNFYEFPIKLLNYLVIICFDP